ncbi:MAG: acyl carrier protein [Ruminococcus sp.]|jgi:acyl carrier protein|nr:acyl carrier protein [Ruminococcus sp.]
MKQREEIFAELTDLFRDFFDDPSIVLNEKTTADDIEDWDSLEHISLIARIEKNFNMRFKMSQVTKMKNVGEMVDIISGQ